MHSMRLFRTASCRFAAPRQSVGPILASVSTARRTHSTPTAPLNLPKWLDQNSHLLKPPINNYCVFSGDATVMVVGGPNARTDYHINTTPEYFYQHRGPMLLKTMDTSTSPATPRDIPIYEGDMFLLPCNTPHNPVRFADTVGVVVEQNRPQGAVDRLRWYCEGCGSVVAEKSFVCTDLGTQIKKAVETFDKDEAARRCRFCGTLCRTRPADVESMRPKVP